MLLVSTGEHVSAIENNSFAPIAKSPATDILTGRALNGAIFLLLSSAPITTAAPSVSGTTDTATTTAATINENGTGYYLVQAAAAAPPDAATVIAANHSFAMTANIQATAHISGLTASTAYKVYFVAKDAAGNIPAVGSVAVTTATPADTTDPNAPAGLDLAAADDSGSSNSDNLTSTTSGLTISGTAEADSAVRLYDTDCTTLLGTGTATGGVFSIDVDLAAGSHTLTAKATDTASNTSVASAGLAVIVDTTAATTTAAASVSGTTDTATTLAATINENGVGYYLVQAAAEAPPDAATVIAANHSFAMTANVQASANISGLAASTAYKVYFVAKDAAGNIQATVGSVDVTTTATPDTTAPTTSAGPSVSGTTDTGTTLSSTINENGTGYYLVQAFAAAAPSVAAVQAGTSFAMTANVAATPAIGGLTAGTAYKIYFVAKDAANNVQAAVQSVAVTTNTNTAPTANNFTYGTNIDNTAKTFNWMVLSAAADAEGDTLTANVLAQGAKGSFGVAGDNVTYTPSADQTASDSGTLRISDGQGGSKDITVTVNGIDTAPPAAPTGLAINAGAATTNSTVVSLDGLTTPPDADLAAWFVSESSSAPASGAAGWNSTKPTSFIFATATNETKTVCVYVKDTLGNVQQTGACDTIYKMP